MSSIKCDNCGKQIARAIENGLIHFSFATGTKGHKNGYRFQYLASPSDNGKAQCPHCGHWTGIWEMTTMPKVEFISERY